MGAANSAIFGPKTFIRKTLNEIQFEIKQEEVEFIQTGIETLVTNIAEDISKNSKDEIGKLKQEFVENVERFYGLSLTDQSNVKLKERPASDRLIKVGSFYEETKNHFPDEFDFVFVIGTFEATNRCAVHYFLGHNTIEFIDIFKKRIRFNRYKYISKESTAKLYLKDKIPSYSGPSRKLLFLYNNENGDNFEISVDTVPAFKIYDPFLTEDILTECGICSIPDFNRFIAETGSYIVVDCGKVSFTETEKRLIGEILSPHHRAVYRLVKHLINGKNKNEDFKKYCKNASLQNLDISSFTIKTTMIAHHFMCTCNTKKSFFRRVQVCTQAILSDLKIHVARCHRRHILYDIELKNNSRNIPQKSKKEQFKIFGSKYISVLEESLNPRPWTFWRYLNKNIDKSYSQYMLYNRRKF